MIKSPNYILTTIIFLFTFSQVKSQSPPWEWARTVIGSGINIGGQECFSIASDQSGFVYLSGFYHDTSITIGSYNFHNNGIVNILVTKYDFSGNIIWAISSSGAGDNECNSITTDNSGNFYITGKFTSSFISFGSDTLFNQSTATNIFLAKFNSSGSFIWGKCTTGSGAISKSIAVDYGGNVYIFGSYSSPSINFDSFTLTNAGGGSTSDLFLVKYNSSGIVEWAKNIGGTNTELGNCVSVNHHGEIYITGSFASQGLLFDTFSLSFKGALDLFLSKLDSSGNVIWAQSFGSSRVDESLYLTNDFLGNIYITGKYNSDTLIFGLDSIFNSGYNAFISKFDSSGTVLWAKTSIGSGNNIGYCIVADSIGNVFVSGSCYNSSTLTFDTVLLQVPSNASDPMFIVKYDSTGNAIWGKAEISGGDDQNSLALGKNGSIYVGGDFFNVNPFILGCDTLIRTSSEDIFIAKIGRNNCSVIESINKIKEENNSVIFPNPFNNNLNVSVNYYNQSEIILYDILSRILIQQEFTNSISLNTSQLPNGIYIYQIKNKNGTLTEGKIIKQ